MSPLFTLLHPGPNCTKLLCSTIGKMWTKRYLAVWILVASALLATPTQAPSLKELSNIGSLTAQKLTKGSKSVFGAVGSALAPFIDKTSSDEVDVFYKNALESLKEMEWNPCVRRLCQGSEMKVWDMRVSFAQKDIQMKVANPVRDSDTPGGLVIASVRFTFPGPMQLSAKFKYEGTVMMVPYTKLGEAVFEVGPVTVTVKAKLPETKTALKEVPNTMECQYRMPPNGVTTAVGEKFEILKVNYKSTTKREYSKPNMIESFNKMKKDIKANLVANLESHVVQETQKVGFSCLDAEAQEKWKTPGTSADCAAETCD